jgi:DNA-binding transcriptional LysR family regulator
MDFDSIERFLAVVDHGSFAAAARILEITPQALAISIAKLERSLGLVLFDRERGGITRPTELGQTYLPHARFIMAAERRAVEEVQARRDGRSGWVRLGVGESVAGTTVANAVAELRREVPDARIAIIEGFTQALLERLDRGELDLVAGAPDSERVNDRDLEQKFLYFTHDVIVVRREHPLAGRQSISLDDLQGYTWMLPYARKDNYEALVNSYAEHGLKPPEDMLYCDSTTLRLELLATQDILLFISRDVFWPRLNDAASPFVVLKAPQPTVERHACLMYRSDYPLNPLACALRDKIVEHAKAGDPGFTRPSPVKAKRAKKVKVELSSAG